MAKLLEAARLGQRKERERILRMLDEIDWALSITPNPAARSFEFTMARLREDIARR